MKRLALILALLLSFPAVAQQRVVIPRGDNSITPGFSGTFTGNPTFSGNPSFTGSPSMSGLASLNGWVPSWSARFDSANSASTGTQSNYAAGDTITLATTGGVCTTAPVMAVNSVTGSAINKWLVQNPGVCSTIPTQPQTQASTSGTGTGATFILTYQPFSYQSFDMLAAAGNFRIGGAGSEAAGANFTTTSESTCVGDKACNKVTTGANITAVGHNAVGDSGSNPFTGNNIVCIGTDCMRNPLNGAASDVGVGVSAMKFWLSSFSVAIGTNAMLGASDGSSTGDSNVAIGSSALSSGAAGITATRNIAIGDTSGPVVTTANDNVWIGYHTATIATTAQKNIWLGSLAGAGATGMFESVLVGYNAGKVLTGNSNTCIGDETCLVATSANNNTVIGHKVGVSTLASGSNILLIGTGTNTDSNTSNSIHIGAGGADIIAATGTGTNTTAVLTLHGSGLTIPDITTGTNADVLCVDSGLIVRLQAAASCTISSMRFKRDIEPISDRHALDNILAMRPAQFYMKDGDSNPDKNAARLQVGLIAEDVERIDPRLAIYEPDMRTPKSWRLEGVIAELVGAVQAQQRQIDRIAR